MAMLPRYFKRYRMEIDFRRTTIPRAELPAGYCWRAWNPLLLSPHADVKSRSFQHEMDTRMFASLGTFEGCRELMHGISQHPGFLPQATWLIEFIANEFAEHLPCGTIQGLTHSTTLGSIQNVGIIPEHRGFGLGRALVLKALSGFRSYGLWRVYLDVTAENKPAVELYRSIGFQTISTTYRELPPVPVQAGNL
ncbi:GNAT family N-acetyltransferase [Planctomicrobium sp. SH664]|uniref:GNAT family N-acetyltransferase n=1 Tax=Planctomicrobium sp. SH664 TaxID=3448125 RepID=UPI003F5C7E23